MRDSTSPKPPAPVSLRLTPAAVAALDALVTRAGGRESRHHLAVIALEHGARALAADPRALLGALGLGHLLGALGPVSPVPPAGPVVHPATPVHSGSAPVVARSTRVAARSAPASQTATPAPGKARPGARGDATEEEVDAMVAALRGALARGGGVNTVATAAGMNSGGTRKRLRALLAGERPAVSVQLARAITSAAEKHGR